MGINNFENDAASLLEQGKTSNPAQQPVPANAPGGMCACLSVAYYQPYFNVSTDNILERTKLSFFYYKPENRNFLAVSQNNPDIYGPFWLSTTLIFAIAASSNFASWMSFLKTTAHPYWTYDFNLVVSATSLVYGFTFGVPLCLWAVCKYLQIPLGLISAICLYGYSTAVFIPTCLLCIIPSHAVDWLLLLCAVGLSGGFLALNLWPLLVALPDQQRAYLILCGVLGAHSVFGILLKVYFFQHTSFSGSY